ncbi:MAG: phage portal protein [Oscillospiraceae bacterium]
MKYSKIMAAINKELGIESSMSSSMIDAIELWSLMYENKSPWISKTVKGGSYPAAIATEIARLTTLELVSEVSCTNKNRQEYINEIYKNKVLSKLRTQTEYACAKGGLVFKPYTNNGQIEVQFIQADDFFPISWDNSENITMCAFVEQTKVGKDWYTKIEIHSLNNGSVHVKNICYKSKSNKMLGSKVSFADVSKWADIADEADLIGIDRLPFGYFKMPIANTIDTKSPLGVSVYSRAVQKLKEADERESQIDWEYRSKETAVHIAESLLRFNAETGKHEYPNSDDRLYRKIEYNSGAVDKPLLDVFSPEIRDQSLYNGLNNLLREIEFLCCLAYGTLSNPENIDKTAEEIRSSKQRSYTTISDTQLSLQKALIDLVHSMDYWCTIEHIAPEGKCEVSFDWDDSIIVDPELERKQDREDVAMGAMSIVEYRMKWYGEDEETAKENVPQTAEVME